MHCRNLRALRIVLAAACLALGLAPAARAWIDPTALSGQTGSKLDEPPIYIFLNAPADVDAFLKRWNQPDFVLQKGEDFLRLVDRAQTAGQPRPASPGAVIDAIAVQGRIQDDLAHLAIQIKATLTGPGPTWLPVRLDGQTMTDARESGSPLPVRDEGGSWQIQLSGAGTHSVEVDLLVPVRPTADGRRLEIAIPEVASTRFEIEIPQRVVDATAGAHDRVGIERTSAGRATRLSAQLPPRRMLELSWRVAAAPGARVTPLLTARGELAVEIDPNSLRTRSTWEIKASRGTLTHLELTLGSDDELLSAELDDQPLALEGLKPTRQGKLVIPLPEPLRPGFSKRLSLSTRRRLPEGASAHWTVRGYPIANAPDQSGILIVSQTGGLWVDGTPGRGVRQIDLRELPGDLRARPSAAQAYQFLDQPFDLTLDAAPSEPHLRVEEQSTAMVDAGLARLDTWLSYQVTRGGVFEVQVALPPGLDLDSVGPDSLVQSYHWTGEATGGASAKQDQAARVLTVRLTPRARDDGSFQIHLTGRQAIEAGAHVGLALFQPRGAVSAGGRIAVLTARNVLVDLSEDDGDGASGVAFSPAGLEPPSDWPWPADRSQLSATAALWLRHDGSPALLPMRVSVQPRTVHYETTILARVERRRLDVEQDTVCHVHYGTLTTLDVQVPPELSGLWELDSDDVASREPLRVDPDGKHRYRLGLRREVGDTLRLRFRYRLPVEPGLEAGRPRQLEIPWLTVLGGTDSPPRVQVTADPGIIVGAQGSGWLSASTDEELVPRFEAGPPVGLTLIRSRPDAGFPRINAVAQAVALLPEIVASRLWMRTVRGPEGDLRTSAWMRLENHNATLAIELPPGAQWIRARIGGDAIGEMERIQGGGYRLQMPPGTPTGSVLVSLEYNEPARATRGSTLTPLRLLEGTVQETYWELALPWNQTAMGVPAGWVDENDWYWDLYSWRRRPDRDAAALSAWVAGQGSQSRLAEEVGSLSRGGYHSYLFHRQGPPSDLRLPTFSRAWLVALCSGLVLAAGVLGLAGQPRRWLPIFAAIGFAVTLAIAVWPIATLVLLQSSLLGALLAFVALVMQRLLERRRTAHAVFAESTTRSGTSGAGSSFRGTVAVGSDDSTAIRIRPGSTRDHVPAAPPQSAPGPAAEGVAFKD